MLSKFLLFIIVISFASNALAGASKWVDIHVADGQIKIPIKAAGIDSFAVIDSGSQLNVINTDFREHYDLKLTKGKKIKVVGAFGEERRVLYSGLDTQILGSNFKLNNLTDASLGDIETSILLGSGFLDNFIFQIDYPNSKLRIVTRDAIDLRKLENVQAKQHSNTGEPIVKVTLNEEVEVWMLLDTGNSGAMIIERFIAESQGWLAEREVKSSTSKGINTVAKLDTFSLDKVKFGPFTLENVPIGVPAEGQKVNFAEAESKAFSRLQGAKVRGILGFDVLKHFLVTVDYKEGDLHIAVP